MALNETITAVTSHQKQGTARFDTGLMIAYAILIGVLTLRHELWPDEVQQWLIARDSHGIADLFYNRRYEGHMLLWYLILYPFAHLSANVEMIKPINFSLSIIAGYLTIHHFLRGRVEKILFLLAPLPIFYFSVLTRPYMLGYLLVVLLCLALRQPNRRLTIFLLIGALANIHIYFLIAAGCFLLYYLLVLDLPRTIRRMPSHFWAGLLLCLAMFALCIWQVIPPPDFSSVSDYRQASFGIAFAMYSLAMGPSLGADKFFTVFLILLGPFIYLVFLAVRYTPQIGVFLLTSTLGILAFQSILYGGAPWHAGMVYTCVLAAIFLMRDHGLPSAVLAKKLDYTFMAMLGLHACSGLLLLRDVITTPCSNDKYVAAFIKSYCPTGCTVVSDKDFWGVPIAGYLGGQPVYYVNRQEFGTFGILDGNHFLPHGIEQVVEAARRFDNPVMLTNLPATPEQESKFHLKFLRSYSGSMVPEERYFIYVFNRPGRKDPT